MDATASRVSSVAVGKGGVGGGAAVHGATASALTNSFRASLVKDSSPFAIPSNEDIFRLREQQREERATVHAAAMAAGVADKTTAASRHGATFADPGVRAQFAQLMRSTRPGGPLGPKGDGGAGAAFPSATPLAAVCGGVGVRGSSTPAVPRGSVLPGCTAVPARAANGGLAAAAIGGVRTRPPRETMAAFLAKKREIFLVEKSLDVKLAEMRKLENRATQREEALAKSEAMLTEDALRFDAFLKENDAAVQEAIRNADLAAKAKQDKVAEIKRLTAAIAALRSELSKHEEALEESQRYKDFLDSVTPPEWMAEQQAAKKEQREARMAEWRARVEAVRGVRSAAVAAKADAEAAYSDACTQQEAERAERAIGEATAALQEAARVAEPPPPDFAAEEAAGAPEPMYWQQPQQLLAVFTQLEEGNVFLIQNCQEREEALEGLRARLREAQATIDAEHAALRAQEESLKAQVEAAEERVRVLRERSKGWELAAAGAGAGAAAAGASAVPSGTAGEPGAPPAASASADAAAAAEGAGTAFVPLDALTAKVAATYVKCGFDADASISTLQMLTNIEIRLEEHLAAAEQLPPDVVEAAEKAREKDRRQTARAAKVLAQQEEHEARAQRAMERAAAPVFKKVGKTLMTRSVLAKRRVMKGKDDSGKQEDAELVAFLARDLL